MNISYEKFSKKIYGEFSNELTEEEIDDLLGIKHTFTKDSPTSTGKRLVISRLHIIGKKDAEDFNFSINYEEGINILVADNFKGKSTIFKLIKYALTGRDSLKNDVKKWIYYTFLNFRINQKRYTILLDFTKKRLSAKLFNDHISSLEELKSSEHKLYFHAANGSLFEEKIKDFFFMQFSYYSLRWTQKNPNKSSMDLIEAGTSWVTYFKSILLESKDSYSLMYGAQGKKVFEMLLGIELTFPINRLTVKKDNIENEKAKNTNNRYEGQFSIEDEVFRLNRDIEKVNIKLIEIENKNSDELEIIILNKDFDDTLAIIEDINAKKIQINNKNEEISILNSKIFLLKKDNKDTIKEISNSVKQKNDLEEFIQIGAFFSNLDIKHCPACDYTISDLHKKESVQYHKCSLCNEEVTDKIVDIGTYEAKIEEITKLLESLDYRLQENTSKLDFLEAELDKGKYNLSILIKEKDSLPDLLKMKLDLQSIGNKVSIYKNNIHKNNEKNNLISQKAVLQYRVDELNNRKTKISENYDVKLRVLDSAIRELIKLRAEIGSTVINRLSSLMKSEIQNLGLKSISDIIIDANFNIKIEQSGDLITFDDITEGEQLRVKIAFYLSLIQMDIEFNIGRHTRLLIIDSPAKEEADKNYLNGLSDLLESIEGRFGNELQILIATAERKLENVVTNQTVIPEEQTVF